jgi:outer membrane receptor protein involved in Fe transport
MEAYIDTPPPVEAVVVRTAQLPAFPGDAAFSIVRLDPTGAQRLDEALAVSPGAGLFRRTSSLGANPTTQGLSLREVAPSGAGRALVLLDGAPRNDPFGGWVIWSAIPPESLESVELVRGAGAGPYGAGALTGVVSLDSIKGDAVRADASISDLDRRVAAAVSRSTARIDLLATASATHSDGWVPVREGRGAADRPLALDSANASIRLQGEAGQTTVSARLAAYREARGSGLLGAASRAEGTEASLAMARSDPNALGWRLQGWVQRSDLRNSSVAVAAGRATTTPANDQYATPAVGYGFKAALRGQGDAWEVGVDLRAYDGETQERFRYQGGAFTRDRKAGGRASVGGVYAEAQRPSGPWLLTGGVRLDHWSTSGGHRTERDLASGAVLLDAPSGDRDGWLPSARFGARRDFGPTWARTAAYAGFRPPTLNELHRPFRVGNDVTEANPALEPERLYGAEAGIGGSVWSATLFYNRLEGPVTNVTLGAGPATFPTAGFIPAGGVLRQRRNVGAIDAYGLEAEGHRTVAEGLTVSGAVAYTRAEVDGGSEAPQLTGLRPAQAPRLSARIAADWKVTGRITASLAVRHEGARYEDDLNSRRLAAFTAADLRLAYAARDGVEVYAAADNLTDASVATGQTADRVTAYAPPASVRFGVSLRR